MLRYRDYKVDYIKEYILIYSSSMRLFAIFMAECRTMNIATT